MKFNEHLSQLYELARSIHIGLAFTLLALVAAHFCLINFGVNSPAGYFCPLTTRFWPR